ncbi:RagB/SusD family nutrient uptake outer membrane protein [Alistipes sp.]|uniref:RagB/SusD family nutrient uptake outer membrane protein n=1 Tax=Alistipes sp. TaxID=1872444 RepID=UPI0025BC869E|nr:RagB/SusD family nutrient uptake outer membrane protein [Alistipes sp.]
MYSNYQWVYYPLYKTGNYSSATPGSLTNFGYWDRFYIAINQCTIFLNNIDKNKKVDPRELNMMKAEARFLRAYYYFCLFRQYGPVFLWFDQTPDEGIEGKTIDRHTVDQNIDFIESELWEAAQILPTDITEIGLDASTWMGRATKGAALALRSRVLLYAASPLYNGCDLYKGQMKNYYGDYLFPQQEDPEKWQKAADAAYEVIKMNKYDLVRDNSVAANGTTITDEDAKFLNAMRSYQLVWQNDTWTEETIWGWWWRTSNKYSFTTTGYEYLGGVGGTMVPALPTNFGFYAGFGGTAPSLKLIDTYPMWESGRYPVTGYEGVNDMSKPIIDPQSGYVAEGFTDNYKQYVDPIYPEWRPTIKAHNSCIGRDPRYYANVVPNGFYWPHLDKNKRFTCYSKKNDEDKDVTSPYSASGSCIRVGYAWRRAYPAGFWFDADTQYTTLQAIKWIYPAFRMAEIYLNYAEACNEKPQRDAAAACEYLNKVRNRAGLNNIEEAYPGIENDKELLRWCIQRERMVEFSFEAQRHYDACRWMIAKEEYPGENYSLNLVATDYEESYKRVCDEIDLAPNVFRDKDYLCPIYSGTLAEMTNMTQNLGF